MAEDAETVDQLSTFSKSGVYRLKKSNAIYLDPVRLLNRSYTVYRVSRTAYYSRFFDSNNSAEEEAITPKNSRKRKRKRKEKKPYSLNEREQVADQRHQKAKPFLLDAHESLLKATNLLSVLRNLSKEEVSADDTFLPSAEQSFLDIASVCEWQAPLYEITLHSSQDAEQPNNRGSSLVPCKHQRVIPIFNNLVVNETNSDVEAEFLNSRYILPKESCFYMSDLKLIHNMIPAEHDCGFNLIVIDPPWENSSAYQKMKYPTLPSRYFLSLPIKRIAHTNGALVGLWMTNREKLRNFVEKELFPTWGVNYVATFYWLKVKADGSLISELDLFHHRPYEYLLLGYCQSEAGDQELPHIPDNQVVISVPGDYSRKPPVGELLKEYVPGARLPRCIELFAREMLGGWTSWGNEVLRFQHSNFFVREHHK